MNYRRNRIFLRISIVLIMLAGAAALRAAVTGSILGVVHDSSGAVVGGAKVVATNVDTNLSKEAVSRSDGAYRILVLPAVSEKLTVTAPAVRSYNDTGTS